MAESEAHLWSDQAEERAELAEVLNSQTFSKSPVLARLLRYLCDRHFEGNSESVKEYSIALDVLGKQPDFGDKRDSLVRVEIHRLRKKLKAYYETDGARHRLRIVLNPGLYTPHFERELPTALPTAAEPAALAELPEEPEEKVEPVALPVAEPAVEAVAPPKRRIRVYLAVLVLLAIAGGAVVVLRRTPPVEAPAPKPAAIQPAAAPSDAVRIRAGYPYPQYVDRFGKVWSGDRFFQGGVANQLRFGSRQLRHTADPAARDADGELFQTFRAGTFSYSIPLRAAAYELRLYFTEPQFGPETGDEGSENMRVFDLDLNGKPLLRFFDIFSDAGGHNVADVRVFRPVTPGQDGRLTLTFKPVRDTPLVNALEIVPLREALAPIRMVMGRSSFTDINGEAWGPDRFFRNGRTVRAQESVSGTPDPGLYSQERYGHFDYSIPLAPGKYTLRLFFAETHFGPSNLGGGGVGSRIFDVTANNQTLLRDFDLFREVGPNKALIKTFHGLQPNSQGKLVLSFNPVVNYAAVKAIEISPELSALSSSGRK